MKKEPSNQSDIFSVRSHLPYGFTVAQKFIFKIPVWVYLLTVSAAWHFFLISHAEPNVFPDTGSFTLLAEALRAGEWHSGFTFRTPGYPLVLYTIFSVAGWKNYHAVMITQACLGVTIPVLLYALFRQVSHKRWPAFLGGVSFLLDRFSLGLETVPLSEFLCGYTVLAALVAFLYALRSGRWGWMLGAAVVAGINFLIRPTFQYLFPIWAVTAFLASWLPRFQLVESRRRLGVRLAGYVAVFQLFVWGWSFVVWRHTGVFAPSLQLGASMTNHTGTMMELAPDEFAKIRDMYVEEREKRGGDHINLFDQVGWKIAEATSMTLWQLSLEFGKINRYLIVHHPIRYWEQVTEAWERIWMEGSNYLTDMTDPYASGKPVGFTRLFVFLGTNRLAALVYLPAEQWVWQNLPFLKLVPVLLCLVTAILVWIHRKAAWKQLVVVFIWGTINYHMLVHAMVQFTEFGRYKLPVQGLWFSFLIFASLSIVQYIVGIARRRLRVVTVATQGE
ncbi:MAG: glycosyltransferase family 39 protein [Candidatus Sumerlaeaceae bacterium]|nr:glycosyltransferase family 39 protein [Candidatus Sumerlaeaceae bacterium]